MDDNFTNAPRSKAGAPAKIIGTLVILILVLSILGLATGLFNFETAPFF
jgi:hypothetical protein